MQTNNAASFSFVVQSVEINDPSWANKNIRDKDGYYTMPGFVFDRPSRNNKIYDSAHMVDCVTNPTTQFYRLLTGSSLHGEWGHPITTDFARMSKIKESNIALFISKVKTTTLKNGTKVLEVKFKPVGPNGKYFEEALMDPIRNSGLSIRALCKDGPVKDGNLYLFPKALITFDAVSGSGFEETNKRFIETDNSISTEEYSFKITEQSLFSSMYKTSLHIENINNDAVFEHFKSDKVVVRSKLITSLNTSDINTLKFHHLYNNS